MKISGFRTPKHKKFNFVPRHYDEKKEALLDRVDRYQADASNEDKLKERISDSFRRSTGPVDYKYEKQLMLKSLIRLILIIGILVALCFFIFSSDKFTQIIENFIG